VTAPNQPEINGLDSDTDFNEAEIYDFSKGAILKELNISIGSSRLPRFQCACHKLNIAVRTSISNHKEISDILEKICRANRAIRKSIQISQVFRNLKSKLRLPNATRWSSAFLMLESVKRAYDRGAFSSSGHECPVSLDVVELYLQILKPAYLLTNNWQRDKAGITDVYIGLTKYLFELPR